MYRVLHIMAGADAGGISTVVLNYYRVLDRTKIHFDIAVTTDMIGQNAAEMEKLGAKIYRLPLKSTSLKTFDSTLTELLKSGNYQAVHVHENETSYVALRIAKKVGIPQRIAHAHTSSPYTSLKGELRRLSGCILNYHYATNVIGCGQLAGERVFGRFNMKRSKACVLPNAVDSEKFRFDEQTRKEVRRELGVEGKFVVGMVGRLSPEKNYDLAFSIVDDYRRIRPDILLLCAGNGEMESTLQDMIKKRRLEYNIRLLGRRADVNRLYAGFDALLMPSIHEGFPVTAVEAIGEGLPVLLSDTITKELKNCRNVFYLPLHDTRPWLDKLELVSRQDMTDRSYGREQLKKNGLDIHDTAKQLENIYLKFGAEVR